MKEKLIALIKEENKAIPYTDEQLANLMGIRREVVTLHRKELHIGNSRQRRKPLLIKAIKKELEKDMKIPERELTRKMQQQGFDVSRHLIREYRKEILDQNYDELKEGHPTKAFQEKKKEVHKKNQKRSKNRDESVKTKEYKAFSNLIGWEGSLKPFIQQAKAAVLYPPNGLHTLILGETGVGKSDLANSMYEFAKESKMIKKDAPFIVFNCADYADNPQLLMSQLFGYQKGAFTGAEQSKEGLVEKANGSILFLDEVHRLPPEGQELLFYIIDKGRFRRLGETDVERKVKVMIIAATTENADSILLTTFRRRIPMVIELPSLNSRPLKERLEIIKEFFKKEANRTRSDIQVSNESLKALLLYDCPGNVGQLRSDIQVSCARSFLNRVVNQSQIIKVSTEELPLNAKKGLLKSYNNRFEMETLIGSNSLVIHFNDEPYPKLVYEDLYALPEEIYQHIEQRYYELENQGMSREVINYVIGNEIEDRLKNIVEKVEATVRPLEKKDLMKIVGMEIVHVVEKVLKIAERKLGRKMDNLYYVLAVHLSTTIERLRQGKTINNPQLFKIKRDYAREFEIAKEMTAIIEKELSIHLPEDETAFLTMYLRMINEKETSMMKGRVGVVIISHGHVAEGMADVVNRLLGVVYAKSVEMSLDESPETALERTIEVVKNIDEGKGVLILVDMGSLVTFGEIITERTGIKTRILNRTDTVMAIEAVRRALLPDVTLDEIANALEENPKYVTRLTYHNIEKNQRPKIIIAICITGQGSALKVKELLENLIPGIDKRINILPIAAMDDVHDVISQMEKKNKILAIVGTVQPNTNGIPFISLEDIVRGEGILYLKKIVEEEGVEIDVTKKRSNPPNILEVIEKDLTFIDLQVKNKEEAIQIMGTKMMEKGYVKNTFIKAVLERERMGPTIYQDYFVLPHGDPQHVIVPAIGIALLKEKIKWESHYIRAIILLALKPDCISIIQDIYHLLENQQTVKSLLQIKSHGDLINVLKDYMKEGTI